LAIFRRGPKETAAGFWEFPGGKVELGESDTQALARELEEELCVRVHVRERIAENIHAYPKRKIHLVLYRVETVLPELQVQLLDHDDWKWVSDRDLESYALAPADLPLIEEIRRLFRQKTLFHSEK